MTGVDVEQETGGDPGAMTIMAETRNKKFIAHVFGKKGCAKCAMLNRRLDALLATEPWKDLVEKTYDDVETEDGMMYFCMAQCVNPNRIPALVMAQTNDEGMEAFIERSDIGGADRVCGSSMLYQYVGIQTDYGPEGKGIITPEMIEHVLKEATTC